MKTILAILYSSTETSTQPCWPTRKAVVSYYEYNTKVAGNPAGSGSKTGR